MATYPQVELTNAAPRYVDLGTRDLSTRQLPTAPLSLPQHLPKIYLFAEKGPVGSTYVDLDEVTLTKLYGDETFNVASKYYTHQTPFVEAVASGGNNVVVHRLMAPDANDVANIGIYLDVLPTQVPLYQKNSDGSLVLDSSNNPVPQLDGSGDPIMVSGYQVKWVTEVQAVPYGTYQRGQLTQRIGTQVDSNTGVQSTQYPIFEITAADAGEFGNKLAVRLYAALQSDINPFPSKLLNEGKQYPYYFELHRISDPVTGLMSVVYNRFGAKQSRVSLQKDGRDPSSGAVVDMAKVVYDDYINLDPATQTGLGMAYVYDGNLQTVLQMLYDAEKVISDSTRDSVINTSENNIYALNIISFTSSNGSPYQAIKVVDDSDAVRLTRNTNLFLGGASDGTIDENLLDTLVAQDLDRYEDVMDEYQDLVMHPESIIYDSGFTLETKKKMAKFISLRKDTFVVVSTYAHDAAATMLSDQYSVGVALKTLFGLYPESATFGTPVMRAVVVGGSGTLINSLYTKRVPLTYEVAYKAARYMGAKDGAWKNGFIFDKAPGSIITQIKDIDVTWVPVPTRELLWSTGLNFVLNYQIRRQYFPALQTIYENDTSVLNSFFTAVAVSYLHKVAAAAHREFSGAVSLTNAQLVERVNSFVANAVKDKFDGLFVVVPDCTITEFDEIRGFSWTLGIKLYANNMKTVMTTYVDALRMSDLA